VHLHVRDRADAAAMHIAGHQTQWKRMISLRSSGANSATTWPLRRRHVRSRSPSSSLISASYTRRRRARRPTARARPTRSMSG